MSRWSATPMRSPRTTCAGAAPSPTPLPSTSGCSRSSSSSFIAANITRSGSPTRRFRNVKPLNLSEPRRKDAMESAIERIMQTYALLVTRSAAASEEARAKVTDYIGKLFEAGEKDPHRLTVCGLTYLRELDGSTDPVKAGFTGL